MLQESDAYLGSSAGKGRGAERRGESEDTKVLSTSIIKKKQKFIIKAKICSITEIIGRWIINQLINI